MCPPFVLKVSAGDKGMMMRTAKGVKRISGSGLLPAIGATRAGGSGAQPRVPPAAADASGYFVPIGLYENFCPPTEASYINPPLAMVTIATPRL